MGEKKKISPKLIWAIISFLLAILTIRVVLRQSRDISISDLVSAIGSSNKLFFILGVIAAALYVWFEGVAICSILKKSRYMRSPVKGLLYSTSDIYFSAITPSATGGQPASAFFMIRDGIPTGITTSTLVIALFYVLAALIRLAYFNATSEIRSEEASKTGITYYIGVPVTASALVFPLVMIIHFFSNWDLTIFYFLMMLIMAMAFVINIKVRKPGKLGLAFIILLGLIEFIMCIVAFGYYTE